MTNEQREAIELLEYIRDNDWTTKYIMSSDSYKAETVLSLIKEQQKEIEKYKTLYERALTDLVKADKQIELMADFIGKYHCFSVNVFDINNECTHEHDCKDCIKQYFAEKE